jgi:hypothetical protein
MKRILILIFGTLSVFILMIIVMVLFGYTPEDNLMKVCVGLPTVSTYFFLDRKTKP